MSTKPQITKHFSSANEFLKWATEAPCMWEGSLASQRYDLDGEWSGTRTYDEAYKLARYGWDDGVKMLRDSIETEPVMTEVTQPETFYDVAGDYPMPALAAAGEPFSMVMNREADINQPITKFMMNIGYPLNIRSEEIMLLGGALFSYIKALESKGLSTQLDVCMNLKPSFNLFSNLSAEDQTNGSKISFYFPLKKAGQNLSIPSLIFWWAHPSSLRRIGFSAVEKLDVEKHYADSYGCVDKPDNIPFDTVYFDYEDIGETFEACLKNIRAKHKAIDIKTSPSNSYHNTLKII